MLMFCFLADEIYSDWMLFAKPMHRSTAEQETKYSKRQEAVCMNVERCIGVLQSRFEIMGM